MSCDDNCPRVWIRVRDGSTLEYWLVPDNVSYAQDVVCLTNARTPGETVERWERHEVTPGPKEKNLRTGNRYDIETLITFLGEGETTIELHARILRPDGSAHGTEFCTRLTGRLGDISDCPIAIFTRRDR